MSTARSAEVRAQLSHPVIDGDGHWLEPIPIFFDFLRDAGGPAMVDRFRALFHDAFGSWYELTPEQRLARRQIRPPWWGEANNVLDRATAMMPALLYERLSEFGIDFAVVYTTIGLFAGSVAEDDLRRAYVRATNEMNAEMFTPYRDRLTPVAVVPTITPEEAVDELTYVREELGMKAVVITAPVRRPIAEYANGGSAPTPFYVDALLDGPYDYDPV